MARAAMVWSVLLLAAAGCDNTRDCKPGTLLVTADYPSGVEQVTISVTLEGGAENTNTFSNATGTSGSVEVDFTTYPVGAMVTVRLRGLMGGMAIAGKSRTFALEPTCTRISLTLDGSELDGGALPSCSTGTHYCAASGAGACLDDTSVDSCGTSCDPCPVPAHGSATCSSGSCGVTCGMGFVASGSTCDVAAPRPIAPTSNAYTSGRRPTFVWKLAPDTDGAHLEVCTDRACANKIHSADVTGTSYAPTTDLVATGTLFWRLTGRVGATTGTLVSPVWEFQPLKRTATVDTAFGKLDDINNDGYADVVIGDDAGLDPTKKGSFYVHYGSSTGAAAASTTTFAGGAAGERFGISMALLGDVDGDGYSDLLVGTLGSGKAYFFKGAAAGLVTSSFTTLVPPASTTNVNFGYHVAAAGDLNGDGYADAVVGGYLNADQGAWIFYGGPAGLGTTPDVTLTIPVGATWFGTSANTAGDVNRDGYGDLLVGDPGADKAYIYLGGPTGISVTPSQTINSPATGAGRFAEALAGAGDVNGDGYADVVISARSKMQAWIFNGISTGLNATFATVLPSSGVGANSFGESVDCAGDVNGDGYTDVVVSELNSAAQHLYLGTAGGLNTNGITLTTPSTAGFSLAGAGDLNGDGVSDVAVGVPGGTAGVCDVFYGSTSTIATTPGATLTDTGVTGRYGVAVQ